MNKLIIKLSNYQIIKLFRQRRGYSFVEILVTVSLLGIIVVGFSRLFMASLIGEKKARNLEEVKQNGNYVLDIMSEMIRSAREVVPGSCASDSITILNQDGGTTNFLCSQSPLGLGSEIASNSAILLSNSKIKIASCSIFTCQTTTGKPTIVNIDFTLSIGASTDVKEYVSQNFRTTVSLRNY